MIEQTLVQIDTITINITIPTYLDKAIYIP